MMVLSGGVSIYSEWHYPFNNPTGDPVGTVDNITSRPELPNALSHYNTVSQVFNICIDIIKINIELKRKPLILKSYPRIKVIKIVFSFLLNENERKENTFFWSHDFFQTNKGRR